MDLKRLYNTPEFPASFAGKKRFIDAVQAKYPNVKTKDVEKILKATDSYTLHKPTKRTPIYRRI